MNRILEFIRNSTRATHHGTRPVVFPENTAFYPNLPLAPRERKGSHRFGKTRNHPRDRIHTAHLPIRPPI